MSSSSTYEFGIATLTGDVDATWLVQSVTENKNSQEALALDRVGEPVVAHYYQRVNEFSFEVIIPSSVTPPEIGAIFNFCGSKYYVSSVTKTSTNTDFRKYSVTGKRFLAHNLPA